MNEFWHRLKELLNVFELRLEFICSRNSLTSLLRHHRYPKPHLRCRSYPHKNRSTQKMLNVYISNIKVVLDELFKRGVFHVHPQIVIKNDCFVVTLLFLNTNLFNIKFNINFCDLSSGQINFNSTTSPTDLARMLRNKNSMSNVGRTSTLIPLVKIYDFSTFLDGCCNLFLILTLHENQEFLFFYKKGTIFDFLLC